MIPWRNLPEILLEIPDTSEPALSSVKFGVTFTVLVTHCCVEQQRNKHDLKGFLRVWNLEVAQLCCSGPRSH